VLNLVPDKVKAFHEIYRVLKTGGHFSVSDVVLKGELPIPLKEAAEMYVGCISGAVQRDEYLKIIDDCRFVNIKVQKEKPIIIPDEILSKYMTGEEMESYKESGTGIFSITVYAEKQFMGCCCGH
jgi:ubiquinone/menaquinone biosynthesis C-methylase UbiE